MKIAQVLLRYDAPGGVETVVREISRVLHARGHDVRIFASDLYDEPNWLRHADASTRVDGIPVERFHAVKKLMPGIVMPMMPGLEGSLMDWQPDVIHAHSHRYGHLLQSSLVAGCLSIPLVVSTHYHPASFHEPPWKKAILRGQDHFFGVTVYSRAERVLAITEHERSQLREFVDERKIRVVPHGLDWGPWSRIPTPAEARRRLSLPDGYILYAGRLAPNKGLLTLLEAWAGLRPSRRLPLVLVGEEWGMRKAIERRAQELGVEGEVRFLGHLHNLEDYVAAYAGATLFSLPSEYEAFGIVLLEAMAASLPVIATRVGGIPEVVRDRETALLVEYGNVWELRRALNQVIGDPETATRLGTAGRKRVEHGFSWELTTDSLLNIYREIA